MPTPQQIADRKIQYDYAAPMMECERLLKVCHEQIIDKRDLDAAYSTAGQLMTEATKVFLAVEFARENKPKIVIPPENR